MDNGSIGDGGRIIGLSLDGGIAGNRGQNQLCDNESRMIGIPGLGSAAGRPRNHHQRRGTRFIETAMTAIPLATREIGRRLNSLYRGGKPVDVAETIAYFASPASNAVTGNDSGMRPGAAGA